MAPHFFGYGSLVNARTHGYPERGAARIAGWHRVWRATNLRPAAFLSVERAAGAEIDGIIAHVPGGDWAALDAREYAYERHDVAHRDPGIALQIYRVEDRHAAPPSPAHPILLSYLDTVVQGFFHRFGRDGVAAFFASTAGWDHPIHDDRAAPVYPRAQTLSRAETRLVDTGLDDLAARVEQLDQAALDREGGA